MSEVKVDTISERTTDAGVTIEGVKVEDGVATFQTAAGSPLVFEGATADAFETTFAITDPTADRTITFPDESLTLGSSDFVKIHTLTASDDSDLTFSSTYVTSDYKQLIFVFYDIVAATDDQKFQFAMSTDNGVSYGSTHYGCAPVSWRSSTDSVLQTIVANTSYAGAYSVLAFALSNSSNHGVGGEIRLQNHAGTTNIKTWQGLTSNISHDATPLLWAMYPSGYLDNNDAINNVKFFMASGNITSGSIVMWGMK